jgi:hypothetical protein
MLLIVIFINFICILFIVCSVSYIVYSFVGWFVWAWCVSLLLWISYVLCLSEVALLPGHIPFAVQIYNNSNNNNNNNNNNDCLCGLVVRVPDYRSRGQASIPGATRFSEQ